MALTRARERLTLTTVLHKRSKPSVFLDDILMVPALQRRDVQQLGAQRERRSRRPPIRPARSTCFRDERAKARVYSRIAEWAESYRPPVFRAAAIERVGDRNIPNIARRNTCSGRAGGSATGPRAAMTFGNVMHTTIKEFIGRLRKGRRPSFDEVADIYRREWTSAGFEDAYQEE